MNNFPIFISQERNTFTTNELDFQLYDELFGVDAVQQIYESENMICPADFIIGVFYQSLISIKELEIILDNIKDSGANYVSIDFNEDHPDYTFSGFLIKPATPEEIELNHQLKEEIRGKHKQDEITRLTLELEKLKGDEV